MPPERKPLLYLQEISDSEKTPMAPEASTPRVKLQKKILILTTSVRIFILFQIYFSILPSDNSSENRNSRAGNQNGHFAGDWYLGWYRLRRRVYLFQLFKTYA